MESRDFTVARALREFTRYNEAKKRFVYACDPAGARVVVEFLPMLLHINHPALPGYTGDECPCGIKGFDRPMDRLKELGSFFSSRLKLCDMRQFLPKERFIEGIFTIGSTGSLAQTKESDYDIWVVVDAARVGDRGMNALRDKIRRIQRSLVAKFVLDLHFFLMDIADIRNSDFGSVSQEGSGSALKSVLKEEFYRTMTLIEGCVPLWWVVHAGEGPEVYEEIRRFASGRGRGRDGDFIDMGDIRSIPERELMGAALWQMHKALDDPLKSVLKMALLESSLETSSGRELLCERLKRDVHEHAPGIIVDPYHYVLKRVEEHYLSQGEANTVDLLRKCFYLKVNPGLKALDLLRPEREDKASVMVDVVRSWGWSLHTVTTLNGFSGWGVERYRAFGDDIHNFLKQTTVKLIRRSKNFIGNDSTIDEDVEVEVLRRRIEAFYVSKKGKVEAERRVKKREPAYRDLYFTFERGRWGIYEDTPGEGRPPVMESGRVAEILAWLVYNKRFDASTAFHMIPNTTGVVLSDIQALMRMLAGLIPAASSIGLDRASLMEDKHPTIMVVIGNMECPEARHQVREVDVIYMNTWKELFCVCMKPGQLKGWLAGMRRPATEVKLWLPKEAVTAGLTRAMSALVSS